MENNVVRLLLAAVLLPLSVSAFAQQLPDAELIEYIESRIESGEYVGMIVGYIDGADSFTQTFGRISRNGNESPDEHTIFEISSISKTFAATLLAQSVVDDKIALSNSVNEHLETGVHLASHEDREITMLDLASHQSGLPYMPKDIVRAEDPNPYAATTTADLTKSINSFVPDSLSGQGYSYSAFAYGIIAHILSTKYDSSFEKLVLRKITEPLKMSDTVMQLDASQAQRLAPGYTDEGDIAVPLDQGVFRAAGSMYSTLHDLMIWLKANMGRIDTSIGDAIQMTHPLRNDLGTIGLAWHQSDGQIDRSQFGTAHGYRVYVGFLEDGSKGAVVLANTRANVMDIGERLLFNKDLISADQ